ncbi:LAFA_0G13938g1_1 [Lachancea sp. 'fantastica']|nr:LAFA_0G13938g1_1 [Lachancea sp. 'fantastica']
MALKEVLSLKADFLASQLEIARSASTSSPPTAETAARRVKKALESSLQVFHCRIGFGRILPETGASKVDTATVRVEYHTVDNKRFFIVTSASKPILKCDVTDFCEVLELPLQILAHKGLEQELKARSQALKCQRNAENTDTRKRRKVSTSTPNASIAKIQMKYRELDCSPALLSVTNDCALWNLEFSISLRYKKDSPNNFSTETNRFLDTLFSDFKREHFVKHELTHYYVQKQFNHQTAKYTKEHTIGSNSNLPDTPQLNVHLLPFQKDSVHWMLGKEGYFPSRSIPIISSLNPNQLCELLNAHVSFGYEIMNTGEDLLYWNKFTGYILSSHDAISALEVSNFHNAPCAHGVLSEEMGLGKTLEILALLLINKRQVPEDTTFTTAAGKVIRKAHTNLIVCPESILGQWIDEIDTHVVDGTTLNGKSEFENSTHLGVFHYKGFQEVKARFETDDVDQIVRQLAKYDIIICSYTTVSAEVHYAEFSAAIRYRRGNAPKYDYSSPLSLLQFYRIILDEVQMLRGESTNAARCTALLHRIHTWGVSGTPVNSITDFKTVLSYLQFHPFQDSPKIVDAVRKNLARRVKAQIQDDTLSSSEDLLVKGIKFDANDLMNIFPRFDLAMRHSKADVADQIRIPEQHNYIIPLEFLPVEQDNYMNLWNSFLDASGYRSDGRGKTFLSAKDLNYWLGVLRKTCCHALMPKAMLRQENEQDLGTIQTMDVILKNMMDDVQDKIESLHRENFTLKIQHAQVYMELKNEPQRAVTLLQSVCDELILEIKDRFGINILLENIDKLEDLLIGDSDGESRESRAKPYMDLLHQCFFFIATAYYFLGSKKLEAIDDENERLVTSGPAKNKSASHDTTPKKYSDVFSREELDRINSFQQHEQENYGYAETLRKVILADRIRKVDKEIESVRHFFELKKASSKCYLDSISFDENDQSSNMNTALCYKRLKAAFQNLNNQATQFNSFVNELKALSYKPLIIEYDEQNQDEKAKDYENTIENQDKVFALLDCLERSLVNREEAVSSDEDIKLSPNLFRNTDTISNYHVGLISQLNLYEGPTLKMIFTELKNVTIVNGPLSSSAGHRESFDAYLLAFESEIPRIKKEIKTLRENIKKLNEIYNAKTNYFSNLQRISDSLVSLIQLEPPAVGLILKNTKNNVQLNENLRKINNLRSRLKYLETLTTLRENLNLKKKFNCAICLSEIFVGSMIKCGHFFCKSCIHSWLKNKSACPLCKMATSLSEVYTFKFQEAQVKDDVDEHNSEGEPNNNKSAKNSNDSSEQNLLGETQFSQKYQNFENMEKVHQLTLKETYGCKVDFAVKLVLYLQICYREDVDRNPSAKPPQIIIYSQYSDFLDILSSVLTRHAVKHLNTSGSSRFSKSIEKFKREPANTCLLLDVKKQATGLTLVNATHVFIMEPIINDSAEIQAINRTHRIGQTRETYVWNFLVRNTVEQNIVKYKSVLEEKKASVKKVRSLHADEKELKSEDTTDNESLLEDDDDEEYSFNVNGDESVSGKHIWNCFFHP